MLGWGRAVAERIQRKRTKGWRMPEGAIYVGRPTEWGNMISTGNRLQPVVLGDVWDAPFVWHVPSAAAAVDNGLVRITPTIAVELFRHTALGWNHDFRMRWLAPLRGHDLVCWCPLDQPCHADVLLELANR
jgi:hypothetical protein